MPTRVIWVPGVPDCAPQPFIYQNVMSNIWVEGWLAKGLNLEYNILYSIYLGHYPPGQDAKDA